jgi:putative FmdB family regulatory protein
MPVYDYECARCGPFTAFRAMADYAKAATCDDCGANAPRAFHNAPALATMDAGARRGMAVNEKSRHEPRRSSQSHPAGCGCCGPAKRKAAAPSRMAKSFPGSRPWMISH